MIGTIKMQALIPSHYGTHPGKHSGHVSVRYYPKSKTERNRVLPKKLGFSSRIGHNLG